MSGTDVALSTLLEQAMALAAQNLTGAVIGKVDSYTPATQRANVTSLVPLLISKGANSPVDDVVDPVISLTDVPVEWPESHNAAGVLQHSIRFPLPVGSFVSIEPKGHDHSQWFTSGSPGVTPADNRRFSISDVVVRPMAPVPFATAPVEPLSYDAAFAVLFGAWCVGGNAAATKAVGLTGDSVDKAAAPGGSLSVWMGQVETFINGLVIGTVTPLSSTFTQVGTLTATAAKLKAI